MAGRETKRHKELKALALRWALEQRFRIAAPEVSVPQLAARLDVAACRAEPPRRLRGKAVFRPGATMILECKQDRADFLKDARSEDVLRERLRALAARREQYEESMRRNFPTLREGETLFPEYDVYRFREVGWEPYDNLIAEMDSLSRQLHSKTKFAKLVRWRAANLCYVVAFPGVAEPHELPMGWGLLEKRSGGLELVVKADWQDASDANRWGLLMRVAMAATDRVEREGRIRSVNLELF